MKIYRRTDQGKQQHLRRDPKLGQLPLQGVPRFRLPLLQQICRRHNGKQAGKRDHAPVLHLGQQERNTEKDQAEPQPLWFPPAQQQRKHQPNQRAARKPRHNGYRHRSQLPARDAAALGKAGKGSKQHNHDDIIHRRTGQDQLRDAPLRAPIFSNSCH